MAYEMKHAGYGEYKKFCEAEHLVAVPQEEYTGQLFLDLCAAYKIPNAVNSASGKPWDAFGSAEERTAAGLGKSVFADTDELKQLAKDLGPLA